LTTASAPTLPTQVIEREPPANWLWAAVFALCAVVYLGSAWSPSLQDDADSTHAEAAREMLVRGDYVTLHVNGVRYLEKAPLPYWLVAFSYRIFGVNEFATRFPTVVAMFLLVLLASRWANRAFPSPAGMYAALFITTTAGYYLFTRILIPEAILSLLIAASFYFFLTALSSSGDAWRWYAGYACLALAVLTKGLVSLVFVGLSATVLLVWTGEWRRWKQFRLPSGLMLFLLIAAPWHLLAGLRNPRFFWFYFVNEHFLRFLGKRYPVDYNKVPAAFYWTLHLVWLFPWSMYFPLALRRLPGDFRSKERSFGERTRLLCWIWAGVILTFFSFSTNQEYYTLPAYLPLLMLLAASVADEERSGRRGWLIGTAALTTLLALVAGTALVAGLWSSRHMPFVPDLASVLAQHNMEEDTLSMSHILDLTGPSFAALRLPAGLAAVALILGPATALWLRSKKKDFSATWTTAITMGAFLVAAHIALGRFDSVLSSKAIASDITRELKSNDAVAIYGDQAFGSSLLFYLKRPIFLVNGRTTSMWFGSTYPDAPKIYWDEADLQRVWSSDARVFLFVPPHLRSQADRLLPRKFVVTERSGKIVYSNRL